MPDKICQGRAVGLPEDSIQDAPGLYVHVPFCHSECTYCDFYRVSYRELSADRYLHALEIELGGLPRGFEARTVYVGGGTPSALREGQLDRLLELLQPFALRALEWTFEVNPKSATEEKVERLSRAGVTRVSFGAQTFSDAALEMLGRRHRAEDIPRAYRRIRDRIPSVSFDLIFALPGEGLADWDSDLDAAIALSPDHLSVYSLMYESGTPLERRASAGEIARVPEEEERRMFLHARRRLGAAGYEHYEVSSYARSGHRSVHNQAYWEGRDYFGVGPGASSTVRGRRWMNARDLEAWRGGLESSGSPPREEEILTPKKLLNEFIMLRLRTADGLSLREFRERTGRDLEETCGGNLGDLRSRGLLYQAGDVLSLTEEGLCVADGVIARLMDPMDPMGPSS